MEPKGIVPYCIFVYCKIHSFRRAVIDI